MSQKAGDQGDHVFCIKLKRERERERKGVRDGRRERERERKGIDCKQKGATTLLGRKSMSANPMDFCSSLHTKFEWWALGIGPPSLHLTSCLLFLHVTKGEAYRLLCHVGFGMHACMDSPFCKLLSSLRVRLILILILIN